MNVNIFYVHVIHFYNFYLKLKNVETPIKNNSLQDTEVQKKEIEKAKERFGAAFNEQEFITTNPRVVEYLSKKNIKCNSRESSLFT